MNRKVSNRMECVKFGSIVSREQRGVNERKNAFSFGSFFYLGISNVF
jgi:hypothetical protein